jgi:hypothetical protein
LQYAVVLLAFLGVDRVAGDEAVLTAAEQKTRPAQRTLRAELLPLTKEQAGESDNV